jgi:hypothetical protein
MRAINALMESLENKKRQTVHPAVFIIEWFISYVELLDFGEACLVI